MSITPSHIIEYLYCPRFTYFEYVLRIPQHEDKYYKVNKGRDIHNNKSSQNIGYARKRIGVKTKYINQYLTNNYLRGEVDEVLFMKDDTIAPLDYKFAAYKDKIFETYKTQLYCYAWLIDDNYKKTVNRGYLVYTRSANKLIPVNISAGHIEWVKQCARNIYYIIRQNFFPKATKYKKRCLNCTYRNICIQ